MNDLVKVCVDHFKGKVTQYSKDETEQVIRKAMFDLLGIEKFENRTQFRRAMRNHPEIFSVIEEVIDQVISNGELQRNAFYSQFVEEKNLMLGDTNEFYVEASNELRVAKFSGSHWDLNRQRIDSGTSFRVSVEDFGIKVYEYFERFMCGRTDFPFLISKVAEAIDKFIGEFVVTAFKDSMEKLPSVYKFAGNYNADSIIETIEHVQAVNGGAEVNLVGTRSAINKLIGKLELSQNMMDELNTTGTVARWRGYNCIILPQLHKANSTEFIFDLDKILILPSDVRPIKLVKEGGTEIKEISNGTTNADRSMEYTVIFKMGLAIIFNRFFGTISITG